MPHLSHCGVKNQHSPAKAIQRAHASRAPLPVLTYVVSRKDPSLHLSSAFLAAGFPENSTMPFPEDRPLSSTITTALSTWPNTEKASSRSSLDTNWGRFLTVSEALWQAKRTRSCFPRRGMLSSSTLAISARVRVSCRQKQPSLKLPVRIKQTQAPFSVTSTSERNKWFSHSLVSSVPKNHSYSLSWMTEQPEWGWEG